jgi:hypothetical protein
LLKTDLTVVGFSDISFEREVTKEAHNRSVITQEEGSRPKDFSVSL